MEIRIITYLIIFAGVVNLLRMALFLIGSDIYGLLQARKKKRIPALKNLPLISVVIPAKNEEKTVIRAVKSVLASDYPRNLLNVIVVDDGSTDNTLGTVLKYKKEHPDEPLEVLGFGHHGKAHALNSGIMHNTDSELVMCLDADSMVRPDALRKAASYFNDPKVVALSSNVKIIPHEGLLNIIQRYEYMICYQMKRAESLFNFEYIIGGIGSVFRRSILEKVNYYDTNTVTEDIDITMKILQLGNKQHKVLYGADVVTYTESANNIADLIGQRFRWKWGRCQTFLKNLNLFFARDRKHTKSLTWFYLPFALYGDLMYLIEPILFSYILTISVYYKDPLPIISAWIVITFYVVMNILAEETWTLREKVELLLFAPFQYILFYILSFVEYIALLKSLVRLPGLKDSLAETKARWMHISREFADQGRQFNAEVAYYTAFVSILILMVPLYAFLFTARTIPVIQKSQIAEKPLRKEIIAASTANLEPQVYFYMVQEGDSLWRISRKFYGRGALWEKIIVYNTDPVLHPGEYVGLPEVSGEK